MDPYQRKKHPPPEEGHDHDHDDDQDPDPDPDRDPKRLSLNNRDDSKDNSNSTAAATTTTLVGTTTANGGSTAVRYKVPTEEERNKIEKLLDQTNGFNRLFHPEKLSEKGQKLSKQGQQLSKEKGQRLLKEGQECQALYVDIPEEEKWWKDDDELFLQAEWFIPNDILLHVSDRLRSDKGFIIQLLTPRRRRRPSEGQRMKKNSGLTRFHILQHCTSDVVDDGVFLIQALDEFRHVTSGYHRSLIMEYASRRLKDDSTFVKQVCGDDQYDPLSFASNRIKDDAEFILSMVKTDNPTTNILEHASLRLRDDFEFMLRAQRKFGTKYCVAKFASQRLRNNKGFMLSVQEIAEETSVFPFVSDQLLDDGDFLLRVWSMKEAEIDFNLISMRLRDDKAFCLKYIDLTKKFENLETFSARMREDEDVVRLCLRTWKEELLHKLSIGEIREYQTNIKTSPLRLATGPAVDSTEFVMTSVKYDPASLRYASPRLRADENLVLSALRSWRDSIPGWYRPFKLWKKVWSSVASSLKDNMQFISKVLRLCPYFLSHTYISRFGWEGRDIEYGFVNLVNIALGNTTSNEMATDDFWTIYYGTARHRRRLINYWTRNSACNLVQCYLRRQETILTRSGGAGDSLTPIFDRNEGTKRRFDGFIDDGFNLNDWKSRKWERLWLIERVGNSYCKTGSSHNEKLPVDVVRCIVGFAGIDIIIKKTEEIEEYVPLLNLMLRRHIVVPKGMFPYPHSIFNELGLGKYLEIASFNRGRDNDVSNYEYSDSDRHPLQLSDKEFDDSDDEED